MARSAAKTRVSNFDAADGGVTAKAIVIFAVTSLAILMSSIDATIVSVGLPAMMKGLDTNLIWLGWVITAYSLTQTIVLPMAGKFSDEFGRKRLFLACVAIFTVSSGLCAIAPNVYLLIVFRVFQAIGGGAFLPSAAGIVSDVFGPERRATAIGLFSSIFPIGGIIGPNLGGWIIDHVGWRAIFSVNLPIGITLFVLGMIVLPSSGRVGGKRGVDPLGIAAFGVGIVGLLYGMTVWGENIDFGLQVAFWLTLGVVALSYWVYHEGRARAPMVEIRLLKERAFFAANLYNFLYGGLVFGFFTFIPLYATLEYGMSASEAGFILTPRGIAMILLSVVSSFLLIRLGYRLPMIAGVVLVSIGLYLTAEAWHGPILFGHTLGDLTLLSVLMAITGLGVGVGGPAANNAAIDLMPEAVAQITGLRGMFRMTGGVLGTATIVLILAHYQDQAQGLKDVFHGLAILILLIIPPIFLIPDTARLRRRDATQLAIDEVGD